LNRGAAVQTMAIAQTFSAVAAARCAVVATRHAIAAETFAEFTLVRTTRTAAERAALAMFGLGCVECFRRDTTGRRVTFKHSAIRQFLDAAVTAVDEVAAGGDSPIVRMSTQLGLVVPLVQPLISVEVSRLYQLLGVHTADVGNEGDPIDAWSTVLLAGRVTCEGLASAGRAGAGLAGAGSAGVGRRRRGAPSRVHTAAELAKIADDLVARRAKTYGGAVRSATSADGGAPPEESPGVRVRFAGAVLDDVYAGPTLPDADDVVAQMFRVRYVAAVVPSTGERFLVRAACADALCARHGLVAADDAL
jgi:hypothetical protein